MFRSGFNQQALKTSVHHEQQCCASSHKVQLKSIKFLLKFLISCSEQIFFSRNNSYLLPIPLQPPIAATSLPKLNKLLYTLQSLTEILKSRKNNVSLCFTT